MSIESGRGVKRVVCGCDGVSMMVPRVMDPAGKSHPGTRKYVLILFAMIRSCSVGGLPRHCSLRYLCTLRGSFTWL